MNILFDIDDTLYDQKEIFKYAWDKVFADRDDTLIERIFIRSRALSGQTFLAIQRGELSHDEMYVYRITEAMSENGICISRKQGEDFQAAYLEAQSQIRLSETMKSLLDDLKKNGVRLGILSNGGRSFQREKIKILGLEQWFDPENIFISEEIGYEKPDDRAFQFVSDRWQIKPSEIILVGDAYDHDIVGAASSGLQTIWMNRRHYPVPEDQLFLPDYIARSEEELAEILNQVAENEKFI